MIRSAGRGFMSDRRGISNAETPGRREQKEKKLVFPGISRRRGASALKMSVLLDDGVQVPKAFRDVFQMHTQHAAAA